MTIPAVIVAVFFLVLRYAQVDGVLTLGRSGLLLDKWDFGVGRIINFTAVAVLAIRFRSALRPFAIRPLVMLGQASLPVFCVHLLCVFFALTIMGTDPIIRDWKAVAIVIGSLSAVLVTAKFATNRRANSGGNRATGPKVPTPPLLFTNQGSRRRRWFETLRKIGRDDRITTSSDSIPKQAGAMEIQNKQPSGPSW